MSQGNGYDICGPSQLALFSSSMQPLTDSSGQIMTEPESSFLKINGLTLSVMTSDDTLANTTTYLKAKVLL